jgi:predicted nucleic acid-binding protein
MMIVWWATHVECCSAFARLRREGHLSTDNEIATIELLSSLRNSWSEILSSNDLRDIACRMLLKHPLRSADALQLASALVWAGDKPHHLRFICLDERLRDAARQEGFTVIP